MGRGVPGTVHVGHHHTAVVQPSGERRRRRGRSRPLTPLREAVVPAVAGRAGGQSHAVLGAGHGIQGGEVGPRLPQVLRSGRAQAVGPQQLGARAEGGVLLGDGGVQGEGEAPQHGRAPQRGRGAPRVQAVHRLGVRQALHDGQRGLAPAELNGEALAGPPQNHGRRGGRALGEALQRELRVGTGARGGEDGREEGWRGRRRGTGETEGGREI